MSAKESRPKLSPHKGTTCESLSLPLTVTLMVKGLSVVFDNRREVVKPVLTNVSKVGWAYGHLAFAGCCAEAVSASPICLKGCYARTELNPSGRYAAVAGRHTWLRWLRLNHPEAWRTLFQRDVTRLAQWYDRHATPAAERTLRLHHSGDIMNRRDAETVAAAMAAMADTDIRVWIPTRTWVVSSILPVLRTIHALPHVTVRPSALNFDDAAPVVEGLAAGATVLVDADAESLGVRVCPGVAQHTTCRAAGCGLCFAKDGEAVGYPGHGQALAKLLKRRAA